MEPHWLVRPRTIRLLWRLFAVALAPTVVAEFFVARARARRAWPTPSPSAPGSASARCAALILFAKGLGVLLKRPDAYYDDRR